MNDFWFPIALAWAICWLLTMVRLELTLRENAKLRRDLDHYRKHEEFQTLGE